MARVTILPDRKQVDVAEDKTLYQALKQGDIPLAHTCGGNGRCSTCRVLIIEGNENCQDRRPAEKAIAGQLKLSPDIRLACQLKINGDVILRRLVLDDDDIRLTSKIINEAQPEHAGVEMSTFILFADIRKFTSFSENLPPYDIVHVLNRYFDRMGRIIEAHGGYIDNYMGDGILALFEADDQSQTALQAVHAAIEMQQAVNNELSAYLNELWGKSFKIGIGLHFGLVVAGTIGAENSRRTTVIGDAVNFASRLDKLSKNTKSGFLISETVYRFVKNKVNTGKKMTARIDGKSGEYSLFEVLGMV